MEPIFKERAEEPLPLSAGAPAKKACRSAWPRLLRMSASNSRRLKGPRPAASAWASSAGKGSEGEGGVGRGLGSVGFGSLLSSGQDDEAGPPKGWGSLGHFYG